MSLFTCPDCHNSISDAAVNCPNCGRPLRAPVAGTPKPKPWKGLLIGCGAVGCGGAVILFLIFFASAWMKTISGPPASVVPEDQLALLSSSIEQSSSYYIVSGEVRNISRESLKSVKAVASWYDGGRKFITSCDALIEYNPVLVGQSSPFKIYCNYNPAMATYTIAFTSILGSPIGSRDARNKK